MIYKKPSSRLKPLSNEGQAARHTSRPFADLAFGDQRAVGLEVGEAQLDMQTHGFLLAMLSAV